MEPDICPTDTIIKEKADSIGPDHNSGHGDQVSHQAAVSEFLDQVTDEAAEILKQRYLSHRRKDEIIGMLNIYTEMEEDRYNDALDGVFWDHSGDSEDVFADELSEFDTDSKADKHAFDRKSPKGDGEPSGLHKAATSVWKQAADESNGRVSATVYEFQKATTRVWKYDEPNTTECATDAELPKAGTSVSKHAANEPNERECATDAELPKAGTSVSKYAANEPNERECATDTELPKAGTSVSKHAAEEPNVKEGDTDAEMPKASTSVSKHAADEPSERECATDAELPKASTSVSKHATDEPNAKELATVTEVDEVVITRSRVPRRLRGACSKIGKFFKKFF